MVFNLILLFKFHASHIQGFHLDYVCVCCPYTGAVCVCSCYPYTGAVCVCACVLPIYRGCVSVCVHACVLPIYRGCVCVCVCVCAAHIQGLSFRLCACSFENIIVGRFKNITVENEQRKNKKILKKE